MYSLNRGRQKQFFRIKVKIIIETKKRTRFSPKGKIIYSYFSPNENVLSNTINWNPDPDSYTQRIIIWINIICDINTSSDHFFAGLGETRGISRGFFFFPFFFQGVRSLIPETSLSLSNERKLDQDRKTGAKS